MTAYRRLSALAAVSLILAAGPAAAAANPTAPESEQDASTVQIRDMAAPNGRNAPRSGISPIAPRSEQNATTVQLRDMPAPAGRDAPPSGVNPSAPSSMQD